MIIWCRRTGYREIHNPVMREDMRRVLEAVLTPTARHITLLKAARDLLKKADDGMFVVDVMSETVFYDDAECDGSCLLEDINNYLEDPAERET